MRKDEQRGSLPRYSLIGEISVKRISARMLATVFIGATGLSLAPMSTPAALANSGGQSSSTTKEILSAIEENLNREAAVSVDGQKNLQVWREMPRGRQIKLAKIATDLRLPEALKSATKGNPAELRKIDAGLSFTQDEGSGMVLMAATAVGTNTATQSNTLTYFGLKVTTLRTKAVYEVSRGGTAYKISSCSNSHTNVLPIRSVSGTNQTWGSTNHLSCQTTWTIYYGIPKLPAGSYTVEQGLTVSGSGVVNRWSTNGF